MNWTGGRLNLHAKSNNNRELKAQKRHFANAQLAIHKQQQLNKAGLSRQEIANKSESTQTARDSGNRKDKKQIQQQKSRFFDTREKGDSEQKDEGVNREPALQHKNRLDQVRERFLKSTDWLGLSGARPVQMRFQTAEEMSKFGRHRRRSSREHMALQAQHDAFEQRFTSPALGKRKRAHKNELSVIKQKVPRLEPNTAVRRPAVIIPSSSPRVPHFRLTSEPTGSSTSQSLPSLPASEIDLDRKQYRLDNGEQSPDQDDVQLPSLAELREFSSFDDIKRQFPEIEAHKDTAKKDGGPDAALRCIASMDRPAHTAISQRRSSLGASQYHPHLHARSGTDFVSASQDEFLDDLTDNDLMMEQEANIESQNQSDPPQTAESPYAVPYNAFRSPATISMLDQPTTSGRHSQYFSSENLEMGVNDFHDKHARSYIRNPPVGKSNPLSEFYDDFPQKRPSRRRHKYGLDARLEPEALASSFGASPSFCGDIRTHVRQNEREVAEDYDDPNTTNSAQVNYAGRARYDVEQFSLPGLHRAHPIPKQHGFQQDYTQSVHEDHRMPFLNKLYASNSSSSPYFTSRRKPLRTLQPY